MVEPADGDAEGIHVDARFTVLSVAVPTIFVYGYRRHSSHHAVGAVLGSLDGRPFDTI